MKRQNIRKTNKKLMLLLLFTVLFSAIISSSLILFESNANINSESTTELNLPKTSAGENITIITPENKTYTEPMSGYYPATCGFENDEIGVSEPKGWTNFDLGSNAQSSIASEYMDHKNVIQLYDNWHDSRAALYYNLSAPQTSGTIEYYVAADYYGSGDVIAQLDVFSEPELNYYFSVRIFSYYTESEVNIQVYDSTRDHQDIAPCAYDTWYHISIDFECGTGGYNPRGDGPLSNDTFRVYINGVNYGDYNFAYLTDDMDRVRVQSGTGSYHFYGYFDAFGFSWDENYDIGDNLNEGLLLSYENNTVLDWQGYSLDGAENVTISGNTTIPIPVNGSHSIQVFANDTYGNNYQSEKRYFAVDFSATPIPPYTTVQIDLINEYGLYIEVNLTESGTLYVSRRTFTFPLISEILDSEFAIYYYKFEIRNMSGVEDNSILEGIMIRFYYDPGDLDDPSHVHLYHYDESSGWYSEPFTHNETGHYIEITLTDLSYFCLAGINIPVIGPPDLIIIIIIILSALGISVPSAYTIVSRRKKKKKEVVAKGVTRKEFWTEEEISQVSKEMITSAEPVESKLVPETGAIKALPKAEKEEIIVPKITEIEDVRKELEKTESEMGIEEREETCQVHKGPIKGITYVCPKCKAKYCLKCASTLAKRNESCWVCEISIEIDFEKDLNGIKQGEKLSQIFTGEDGLDNLLRMGDLNITALSPDFLDAINEFEWEEEDKKQFIEEMLAMSPSKRKEYLDEMRKNNSLNELKE